MKQDFCAARLRPILAVLLAGSCGVASAATPAWVPPPKETVIYALQAQPNGQLDQQYASELVQAGDGNFYGIVTSTQSLYGQIFRLTPSGTYTILHTFSQPVSGVNADGAYMGPYDDRAPLIVGADGNLYGVTHAGGANGGGTVFRMALDGTLTTIYSFPPGGGYDIGGGAMTDWAHALLLGKDGNFYGTTGFNGANNNGTIYKLTPSGQYTLLHSFGAQTGSIGQGAATNADGINPLSALVQGSDGSLYGTTYYGGAYGNGTVFRLAPDGSFTTLHSFGTADWGMNPVYEGSSLAGGVTGVLLGKDGNLYGTTSQGGANMGGAAFSLPAAGGPLKLLFSFDQLAGTNGASPNALMQASDGNLYGTTYYGGKYGNGVIFQLTPAGAYKVEHTFTKGHHNCNNGMDLCYVHNVDGANPKTALIQGQDGNLYGDNSWGGPGDGSYSSWGAGVFFKFTVPGL